MRSSREKKELFLCRLEQDSLSCRFLLLICSVVSVCFARSTELACLLDFAQFLSGEVKTELQKSLAVLFLSAAICFVRDAVKHSNQI